MVDPGKMGGGKGLNLEEKERKNKGMSKRWETWDVREVGWKEKKKRECPLMKIKNGG